MGEVIGLGLGKWLIEVVMVMVAAASAAAAAAAAAIVVVVGRECPQWGVSVWGGRTQTESAVRAPFGSQQAPISGSLASLESLSPNG